MLYSSYETAPLRKQFKLSSMLDLSYITTIKRSRVSKCGVQIIVPSPRSPQSLPVPNTTHNFNVGLMLKMLKNDQLR